MFCRSMDVGWVEPNHVNSCVVGVLLFYSVDYFLLFPLIILTIGIKAPCSESGRENHREDRNYKLQAQGGAAAPDPLCRFETALPKQRGVAVRARGSRGRRSAGRGSVQISAGARKG